MLKPLIVCVLMVSASSVQGDPRFADRSADLPFEHVYSGGWAHFVGGGVAVLDCDGNSFPDIFVAGGENPGLLARNITGQQGGQVLFEAVEVPELTGVTGAYPLDINNDTVLDLFVLRAGPNVILRGRGDCQFDVVTGQDALGLDSDDRWSTAFSAMWERGNSLPTLAVGNYVDRTNPDGPFEACDVNQLYRPDEEAGTFAPPYALAPGYCALSVLFADWGQTGRMDLRVSNDRHYYVRGGSEQMWMMTETDARLMTAADGWRDVSLWGMGIASRDITGDGVPEVMLTSMGDQLLQYLEEDATGPSFRNAPFAQGAAAHRPYIGEDGRPSTGWHAQFGDVDNDGSPDLFITKGNVDQMPGNAMQDPNNLLMLQPDGTFVEAGAEAGIASVERSRGGALTDLNLDGLLDIVIVNRRAPLEIYQNVTQGAGNWLLIDLRSSGINTYAVGAIVEIRTEHAVQTQQITVGGGHAGGQAGPLHFGLGPTDQAEIRITWPDGTIGRWAPIAVNARTTIHQSYSIRP